MPDRGGPTRQDVDRLQQLAKSLREASSGIAQAGRPLGTLAAGVTATIGGTASDADRRFAALLGGASKELSSATSQCAQAAAAVDRAARHVADEVRRREQDEARRNRVRA